MTVTNQLSNVIVEGADLEARTRGRGLFDDSSWRDAVVRGLGYRCFGVLTSAGRNELALIVYFSVKKGPFRLAGSPLQGSHTPCLEPMWYRPLDEGARKAVLESQLHFLRNKGCSYVEWTFFRPEPAYREFCQAAGAEELPRETYLLEIKPDIEIMWKEVESRARNMIRKAEKSGVTARRLEGTAQDLEVFYAMLQETFARRGATPPHPLSFYRAAAKNLIPAGRLLILAACLEDRVLAMGLFPHDEEKVFFLSGASNAEAGKVAASNLLQWEVVRFAVDRGLRFYDMGGKGISSIDKFKQSLGPSVHGYYRIYWATRTARTARNLFFRLGSWKNRLGPVLRSAEHH